MYARMDVLLSFALRLMNWQSYLNGLKMEKMPVYVTTSLKGEVSLKDEAKAWADEVDARFLPRRGRKEEELYNQYENLIIYTNMGPEIRTEGGSHHFHPSMAELRIRQIDSGKGDRFLDAVAATGPVKFLDCTCGLGSDALVASYGLPRGSCVDAVEASPLLARVTAWGFSRYVHERRDVTDALRHIHLSHDTYESVLTSIEDKSYDIIYFDPMFTRPVQGSSNFTPLRDVVCHAPLTTDMIDLALCKAGKRVVIKGRDFSELTGKYDNLKVGGGRYSRISYAVLECSRK